jgi:hypothetical protein
MWILLIVIESSNQNLPIWYVSKISHLTLNGTDGFTVFAFEEFSELLGAMNV